MPEGRAKILDFGLARPPSAAGDKAAGELRGTPAAMSPEQVEGCGVDACGTEE